MLNMSVNNVDLGQAALFNVKDRDDVLNFSVAGTVKAATILARSTVNSKLVPFVVGGANGSGTPNCILKAEVVASGAGDIAIRPFISGEFRLDKLVIHADGDSSGITKEILDQLRDLTMIPDTASNLSMLDNQ